MFWCEAKMNGIVTKFNTFPVKLAYLASVMNEARERAKIWSPACLLEPVNTRYGVSPPFFSCFPEAGWYNPSWIGNSWPGHWFLETLLRVYHGLVESNSNQRWGGDAADGQRRRPGVKVHTFTVMVWFISKCMKFPPWRSFHNEVIRPLDTAGGKNSAVVDAVCWAVSIHGA